MGTVSSTWRENTTQEQDEQGTTVGWYCLGSCDSRRLQCRALQRGATAAEAEIPETEAEAESSPGQEGAGTEEDIHHRTAAAEVAYLEGLLSDQATGANK